MATTTIDPTEHIALVKWWAGRYCRREQDFEDAVQAGTIGLLRAAERFDPTRGVAFSTFASLCIRRELLHWAKRVQPLVRVPEAWSFDRHPYVASLNRQVSDDGTELGDLLPGGDADKESEAIAAETRARIRAALASLPARDALVLRLRYGVRDDGAGIPCTLEEVARLLRVTRERVRQLQVRAEQRLLRRLAG
jgi:RNA polymerase primary sigma factor